MLQSWVEVASFTIPAFQVPSADLFRKVLKRTAAGNNGSEDGSFAPSLFFGGAVNDLLWKSVSSVDLLQKTNRVQFK